MKASVAGQRFDVVVIGSGAGGAPLAWRLAEAGVSVLLVERGRAMRREEFDRDELEWCRRDRFIPSVHTDPHTWRGSVAEAARKTADGWTSTVLGGGTVHMAGYLLRADATDAMQGTRCAHEPGSQALDWAVPFDDVARRYAEVERTLGVNGAPGSLDPPLVCHALADKLDRAARQLGIHSMPTPRGILTVARPDDDRAACDYLAQCAAFGCPTDARASMPSTYLRQAQRTGRLTVWTESLCSRIDIAAGRAQAVVVTDRKLDRELRVPCGAVVVACGAVETPRLLLLSGVAGRCVGKHLWFSLSAEVTGFFPREHHGDVADLMAGSPFLNRTVHYGGHLSDAQAREAGVDRTGMFEASFAHDNPIRRAERVAFDRGDVVWGRALKRELVRVFTTGRTVILEGFAESLPHAGSFVDLDPDVTDSSGLPVARITWSHHERDVRVTRAQAQEGVALLREMGAVDITVAHAPGETTVLQGGTCRFGADPATSVVNPEGALHDVKNVFVADGSALPSSLTVPPTLTIVANSLRVAEHVLRQVGSLG